MARNNKPSKIRQEIHQIYEQNELASLKANNSRARSFSVGTTTGGIIEVSMRGDFANLWYILQPVEAIEMINQLAAAAGVEVAMRPRQDFASWRSWDADLPPSIHWMGAAPWQVSDEDRKILSAAKRKQLEPKPKSGELKSKDTKAIEESKENIENEGDNENVR